MKACEQSMRIKHEGFTATGRNEAYLLSFADEVATHIGFDA
jgi:hypothetical protein